MGGAPPGPPDMIQERNLEGGVQKPGNRASGEMTRFE